MKLQGKIVIVTGAASGIGRALAARFHAEGARLVLADLDEGAIEKVAKPLDAIGFHADVSAESAVRSLVERTLSLHGRVDVFCSNAGILLEGGEETPDSDWQRIFGVNVMAHVYASRAVLPHMLERGDGYLLQTVSAAGLLSQIGSAPYAVTKHAALAFAEWLSITYGGRGIRVSAVCPMGVRTPMLEQGDSPIARFLSASSIAPEQVADAVMKGMEAEQFLILPHPEVEEYFRRKAAGYDRWIRGMRRLQDSI